MRVALTDRLGRRIELVRLHGAFGHLVGVALVIDIETRAELTPSAARDLAAALVAIAREDPSP